jgi:hypothetical protein
MTTKTKTTARKTNGKANGAGATPAVKISAKAIQAAAAKDTRATA